MIVLTNTAGDDAYDTINNLLMRLRADDRIVIGDDKQLSMSVGIAEAIGDISVDDIVIRADQALYQAKAQGRDKAVLHKPDVSTDAGATNEQNRSTGT